MTFDTNEDHATGLDTSEGRRQIVMIVANDVSVDTRVQRSAAAVAATSGHVTILGISPTGKRVTDSVGTANLTLLPVSEVLRNRNRLKSRWPWLASDHDLRRQIREQRELFSAEQLEIGARIGWLRRDYFSGRTQRGLAVRPTGLLDHESGDRPHSEHGSQGPLDSARKYVTPRVAALRRRSARAREARLERRFRAAELSLDRQLKKKHSRMKTQIAGLSTAIISGDFTLRRVDWRWALPELMDLENAFGPELDKLDPDVIHVHDVHLLGVAARSVGRSYMRGRTPKLVYDAHEYIQGLGTYRRPTVAAFSSLEREFIGRADAVVTVSSPLADLLERDYGLAERPTLVMNAPPATHEGNSSIRQATGLSDDALVVVYSGGLDPTRGVHTLVDAIGSIAAAHLVLVSRADTEYARSLADRANRLKFAERLHFAPFVPSEEVVNYISSADIAVHPMVAGPMNHEVALPNKLFEYIHARLPLVVSDCRAMSDLVRDLGIGEVFKSEDVASLSVALGEVIANLSMYRERYLQLSDQLVRYTWDYQAKELAGLYGRLNHGSSNE